MEFGFSTVRAFMGVKLDPDKNPSLEDRLCDRYLGEVKRLSNWNMRPLRPMGECDSYDDITLLEFPAYFSGIAKVAEGLIYESGTSFVILPQDLYCEVIVNRELKSKPDPDDESCFLGVEFIRFTSIMSDYDDAVAINLDASQLFLYREDIERIYTYGLAGEDLPRVWLTDLSQSNQLSVSSMAFGRKVNETAKQANTIAFLINALGVSLEDLKGMPLPKILDKLSHCAKECHLPNITPEALGHWLVKAGVR